MAERPINARQRQKYDTSTNWATNNPILLAGEIGVESDTNKIKIGNGTSKWSQLQYVGGDIDFTKFVTTDTEQTILKEKKFDISPRIKIGTGDYRKPLTYPTSKSSEKRYLLATSAIQNNITTINDSVYMQDGKLYSDNKEVANLSELSKYLPLKGSTITDIASSQSPTAVSIMSNYSSGKRLFMYKNFMETGYIDIYNNSSRRPTYRSTMSTTNNTWASVEVIDTSGSTTSGFSQFANITDFIHYRYLFYISVTGEVKEGYDSSGNYSNPMGFSNSNYVNTYHSSQFAVDDEENIMVTTAGDKLYWTHSKQLPIFYSMSIPTSDISLSMGSQQMVAYDSAEKIFVFLDALNGRIRISETDTTNNTMALKHKFTNTAMKFTPADKDKFIVTPNHYIVVSAGKLKAFSKINGNLEYTSIIAGSASHKYATYSKQTGYISVITNNKLYYSADDGLTWLLLDDSAFGTSELLACSFIDNELIVASTTITKVYKATNVFDYVVFEELNSILTNYAVKEDIPTKTSQLTNDSGFITSAPVSSVNGKKGAVSLASTDLTDKNTIVKTSGNQSISGTKNFTGIFQIGGKAISYDATTDTFSV